MSSPELVELERLVEHDRVMTVEDEQALRSLLAEHVSATGSARAADVLNHWQENLPRFWKVVPDPPVVQVHTPAMESAD